MKVPKVFLIGGAPGAGKTTLGSALAVKLGCTSLSVDDLMIAAQAVTTPETHPGLFVMKRLPSMEYFTNTPPEQLIQDAAIQHEATWPLVERVIRKHASWGDPIVIDGWHMRPSWVMGLGLEEVGSAWLIPAPEVLRAREEANTGWVEGSSDPARMLENFLARSLWYNELIESEARREGLPILRQPGSASVEALVQEILAL